MPNQRAPICENLTDEDNSITQLSILRPFGFAQDAGITNPHFQSKKIEKRSKIEIRALKCLLSNSQKAPKHETFSSCVQTRRRKSISVIHSNSPFAALTHFWQVLKFERSLLPFHRQLKLKLSFLFENRIAHSH
jgi:ribosome-associated toxin RatA of RatAB toxin-antitoxin module